jgi:hypothetical protein
MSRNPERGGLNSFCVVVPVLLESLQYFEYIPVPRSHSGHSGTSGSLQRLVVTQDHSSTAMLRDHSKSLVPLRRFVAPLAPWGSLRCLKGAQRHSGTWKPLRSGQGYSSATTSMPRNHSGTSRWLRCFEVTHSIAMSRDHS